MPTRRPIRRAPVRHAGHRSAPSRRRRWSWRTRLILLAAVTVLFLLTWGILARLLAPTSNMTADRYDAIIVLGYPADADGNPSPAQLASVTEAVHEYERGAAPRLILTGGAVANQYAEARVMARTAAARGIPSQAIFIEPEARNTIENACFATRILKAHGWHTAEVIANPVHAARAGMIFSHLPLGWRMRAAPPLEPRSAPRAALRTSIETLKTVRYLVWAQWADPCQP